MSISKFAMTLGALTLMSVAVPAARAADGEDLNVINKTGRTVTAFLFTDDRVHDDESGGVQFGTLKNGQSAIAHVPTCKFAVVLIDGDDLWHWEFHDCNTPSITFTSNTGHGQRHH
jgi:hypothetical protein